MILLDKGYGKQPDSWHVEEEYAAGFSRVYHILSGDVLYQSGVIEKRLEIGALYIFPSYHSYSISHNIADRIDCLWMHIDFLPTVITDLIEIPVEKNSSLSYLLLSMQAQLQKKLSEDGFFFSLVSAFSEFCYENQRLTLPDEVLLGILSYINANYHKALTVEEISRHFHYTTEHFIRLFQKKVNITPYQYLTNYRMSEAARLLLDDVSVQKVSARVGYQDAKTFSHAFKNKFGIPPTQYKHYYKPIA